MAEKREKYLLNRSSEFTLASGAENRTDLTLSLNPDVNKSTIICIVTADSSPVVNALAKVLTTTGDPVDHQFTNAEGQAVSDQIPNGIYRVVVSAPGFITSTPITVNLPGSTGVIANIALSPDPRTAKNTLYGLVLDQVTGIRLSNAAVIISDSLGQTAATTQTDSDGEYLLGEIDNGSYSIIAEKAGYELPEPLAITVTGSQIAQTNIVLTPSVITEGTVQGFIKDQDGNLLGGATVGLYLVSGSTETLTQQTSTNTNGFYLFGNVPEGDYLIKAKMDILI